MSAAPLFRHKLRRDLRRRRAQVVAVGLTVFVGMAVFVLTADMASNLEDSYDLTYERTSFADVWITGGSAQLAATIETIDGVDRVETRTSADVGVAFDDRPIRTRIVGFGADTTLNKLVVNAGEGPGSTSSGVVLEQHTADHFDLGPGDTVIIAGIGVVDVVGVAVSPEWLWVSPNQQELVVDPNEFGVVFAPEALAAEAAPDSIPQLVVEVADGEGEGPAAVVETVVDAAIGAGAGEVLTQASHPSNLALQADLEGFKQLSLMFPVLFLIAAGLATAVLLSRLVAQQRAEIGMLRANGYSTRAVQRHFASYGVVVSLLGALPAIPVGAVTGLAATTAYTDFLGVPFASRQVRPLTWIIAIVFAVIVGAISGAVAARRATAIDPATAMRPGGGVVTGKRSPLERILPPASPNWLRLAVRNLGRAPGRAVTTALGVVLALLLTMTALVLNDTINDLFTTQFTKTDLRGLVVTFDGPPSAPSVAAIEAVDGVSTVEPQLDLGASLVADGEVVTERLGIYAAGTTLHDFTSVGGLLIDGIVLSAGAASQLGLGTGDEVEFRALDGTAGRVTVAGIISEPFTGSSYISADVWERAGGGVPDTLAVGLIDRNDHQRVRGEVAEIDGVVQLNDQVATAERAEELLAASKFFVGFILILAVIMAVALIFNALAVTIGERETEVATLQANGVGRSWIRRVITAENLVTVGLGLVPGLILGRISAGAVIKEFSTDQFRMDAVMNYTSLVAAVILVVLCALVAQIPGLRRLDRLDLATKVRERAL
ncbi:MAG: ABC transporter permease [Actinomycetia bacterium]|nr:ABC transporter permease [Actinomycetes bacterium]